MKKVPTLNLGECTDCESCIQLCPHIFRKNEETGQIDVVELSEYSEEEIQEAVSTCPAGCIAWEEVRAAPGDKKGLHGKALKQKIRDLLKSKDLGLALKELSHLPARRVINPLFSLLHGKDQALKWAAVKAMGTIVSKLADEDMESARIIMRRLMWNLNDESGGIGWGSPEAMGEILAAHEGLAKEYAHILVSYAREDGNYLEHETLQRGLLWGIGRLAQVRPHLLKDSYKHLLPFLESPDATVRGTAAWVTGLLGVKEPQAGLERLKNDRSPLEIYVEGKVLHRQVRDMAEEALRAIRERCAPD